MNTPQHLHDVPAWLRYYANGATTAACSGALEVLADKLEDQIGRDLEAASRDRQDQADRFIARCEAGDPLANLVRNTFVAALNRPNAAAAIIASAAKDIRLERADGYHVNAPNELDGNDPEAAAMIDAVINGTERRTGSDRRKVPYTFASAEDDRRQTVRRAIDRHPSNVHTLNPIN